MEKYVCFRCADANRHKTAAEFEDHLIWIHKVPRIEARRVRILQDGSAFKGPYAS